MLKVDFCVESHLLVESHMLVFEPKNLVCMVGTYVELKVINCMESQSLGTYLQVLKAN